MKNKNSMFIIVLVVNLLIICLLTLVNSRLSRWGIFLYLPGLFFYISCVFLDRTRGMIVCGITGLFLDVLFITPLGLHALLLPLFHIFGKEWLRSIANHRVWRLEYVVKNRGARILQTQAEAKHINPVGA